jgi:iron complex outermembrane receptor protein
MNLVNAGTTKLSMKRHADRPNDKLNNTQTTAYFDLTWKGKGDLKIKNQLFYDGGQNLNENAYGFAQAFSSYVIEDKIVASDSFDTPFAKISVQASPSLRYTHFHFADDYGVEFWNRPISRSAIAPSRPACWRPRAATTIRTMSRPLHRCGHGGPGRCRLQGRLRFHRRHSLRHGACRFDRMLDKYAPTDIAGNVGAGYGDRHGNGQGHRGRRGRGMPACPTRRLLA